MRRTGIIFGAATLVATMGVVIGAPAPAAAANIVVTTSDDVSADDGRCSLREAINSVISNTSSGNASGECTAGGASDTVTLDTGVTYTVGAPALPTLTDDVAIIGNGSTIRASAAGRVIQVNVGATVELRDLTLTHQWSTTGVVGRGFYNRGTATLRNVTITDNSEIGHGGGVFNGDDVGGQPAVLTIIDSTIEANSTVPHPDDRSGGGIRNHTNATLTVLGSSISENESSDHGGGISNVGVVSITDSSIDANVAGEDGGGIQNDRGAELTIEDSSVSDNVTGGDGGGIVNPRSGNDVGEVTIRSSEVSNNDAPDGSGGGIHSDATVVIDDSTIAGNTAGENIGDGRGGGIYAWEPGTLDITSTVVSGNDAEHGGGIFTGGLARLDDVTIADNVATANGGGIYGSGETELSKSRVTGNAASAGGGIYNGANLVIDTTTIDENTATGSGGGVFTPRGDFDRVTISRNAAGGDGGGILVRATNEGIVVTNSTISGNSAVGSGGGIQSYWTTRLRFTTVTDNDAPNGAGIGSYHAQSDGVDLLASIVAGNRGTGLDVEYDDRPGAPGAPTTSSGYNVLGTVDDRVTLAEPGDVTGVVDPKLGPLSRVGGGPTDSHRPAPTSLAVARAPKSVADAEADGIDQRGAPRGTVTPIASAGSHECSCLPPLVSTRPVRLADSRDEPTVDGQYRNTGQREGGTTWEIAVHPRRQAIGGIPRGVVLNVTALNAVEPGFATIYPCTEEVPTASSLNYAPGAIDPNEVIAKLSTDGTVCIFTQSTVDIVVDLVAWVPSGSAYVPLEPARFADSRDLPTSDDLFRNTGIRRGGTTWEVEIGGRGRVAPSIGTVAVNLTVTGATGPGFATVYPCTDERPNASSINYDVGITRPNELVTKLSPDGTLCVFVQTDVHVVLDVVGYFDTPVYVGTDPARLADSRNEPTIDGLFRNTGPRGAGTEWEIQVAGRGGVPDEFLQSVMVNVTVTEGSAPGFVTVYGCGSAPRPDTSSLNHDADTTRPNELLVGVGFDGTICVFTQSATHVIVDVVGFVATRAFYPA